MIGNIPPFVGGVRCALVKRADVKGLYGVAIAGGRYVCPLPKGYDGKTSVVWHNGYVIVGHPKFAPLICDPSNGTVKVIEPHHVIALEGRIKLVTH